MPNMLSVWMLKIWSVDVFVRAKLCCVIEANNLQSFNSKENSAFSSYDIVEKEKVDETEKGK